MIKGEGLEGKGMMIALSPLGSVVYTEPTAELRLGIEV